MPTPAMDVKHPFEKNYKAQADEYEGGRENIPADTLGKGFLEQWLCNGFEFFNIIIVPFNRPRLTVCFVWITIFVYTL